MRLCLVQNCATLGLSTVANISEDERESDNIAECRFSLSRNKEYSSQALICLPRYR
jgi:hypothetical protein